MKKKNARKKVGGSWRGIRQSARQVKVSSIAKRRYFKLVFRSMAACLLVAAVSLAGWGAYRVIAEGSKKVTSYLPSPPVEDIRVVTDGVIPDQWVIDRLILREDMPLMEVDIHAIKDDLERHGQVRSAVVSRRLPGTLHIQIQERTPMLRLAARDHENRRINLLVAEDGYVYQGVGYSGALLGSMPYVSGVELRRAGGGFQPLQGMEPVAELLALARSEAPEVYTSWKVVSCGDLPLIHIQSEEISEIVFFNEDFGEQLGRLRSILLYQNRQGGGMPLHRADLSLGRDADVPVSAH